jgi:hypothetical protein
VSGMAGQVSTVPCAVTDDAKKAFSDEGYLRYDSLLSADEVTYLRDIYNKFLDGTLDVGRHRYGMSIANGGAACVTGNRCALWRMCTRILCWPAQT